MALNRKFRLCALGACFGAASAVWGASPSVEQALKLSPLHKDVDCDRPTADQLPQCSIAVEKTDDTSGWVVKDGNSSVLRRFIDTNGDNVVDRWCYYRDGLEVYRDVDTDFDGKADEYRWLGPDGTRWGNDTDKDGKLDRWKVLSAEEAAAEIALAMANRDLARFKRVRLTVEEAATLGLGESNLAEVKKRCEVADAEFSRETSELKGLDATTKWLRFDALRPGMVPVGTAGSTKDLIVYENVMAMVQTGNENRMVQIGTLVRVGEVWKTLHGPMLLKPGQNELADRSFFFEPSLARNNSAGAAQTVGLPEKIQELLGKLEKLDKEHAQGVIEEPIYHRKRSELLALLFEQAATSNDREQWGRQLADTLSIAAQSGELEDAVPRLGELVEVARKLKENEGLLAYAEYRYIMADYATSLHGKEGTDFADVQKKYLERLEKFVAAYPDSSDAAECLLQLGIAYELSGKEDVAGKWYGAGADKFGDTSPGKKAAGALRRLQSVGKPIRLVGTGLSGKSIDLARYRGQVVLIDYWATWCRPCLDAMDDIKQLQAKYGAQGFVVIGVNLDSDKNTAVNYIRQNRLSWDSVYEAGGLESAFANELGILTLPTKILIDRRGNVVDRNIHISQVEEEVKKQLKNK